MAASAARRPYLVGAAVILALIAVTNERRSASFVGSQELMASSAFPGRAKATRLARPPPHPPRNPHGCTRRTTAMGL
jgi:hypothetical protein